MAKGLPRSLANAKPGNEVSPRRVRYPVTNLTVPVTGGSTTNLGTGTAVMGTLPEGNLLILGAVSYLQFLSADADVSATWSGVYTIGSAANAAANQTLDGLEIDIVGATTIADATSKLSPVTRGAKATASVVDNTAGGTKVNLNMTTDDNDVTDSAAADFTATGYVEIVYIVLGDD